MDKVFEMLRQIGHELDEDIMPRVMNGGIVTPGDAAPQKYFWAKENDDELYRQRRSETRSWTWATRGQRQADRSREASATASIVSTDLQAQYENELSAVQLAYPGTRVWHQEDGLWMLTESTILPGFRQKAVFLTGIPYSRRHIVRGWGFWMGVPFSCPTWMGPRHTNFPDGSICAFEPGDGTWAVGSSLVVLLDIYTLWALRQLHQQIFQRWPGRQFAHFLYERLTETMPGECCSCGSDIPYEDCCRPVDQKGDKLLAATQYLSLGKRNPPEAVQYFVREQVAPPRLCDLLPMYKVSARGTLHYEIGSTGNNFYHKIQA